MDFFHPRMHHVMSGEGYVTSSGESPVFYYVVAIFYKIFGPHDGIFRLLSLATFLAGLYLLGRIFVEETKDWWAPVVVIALVMCSPVVAFYSFNFTPNIPAQGLTMIGLYFFYRFYRKQKLSLFYISMCLFLLAGLIKISALMSFLIVFGLFILERLGWLNKRNPIFKNTLKLLPGFLFVFVGLYCWKLWADHYNEIHDTKYFLSTIKPIWGLDENHFRYIVRRIEKVWYPSYHHPVVLKLFYVCIPILFFLFKKIKTTLYIGFVVLTFGSLAFLALWFRQFEGHDYYVIEFILLFLLVFLLVFGVLVKWKPKIFSSWVFRALLISGVIYCAFYTKENLNYRYDQNKVFMSYFNPDLYKKEALHGFLNDLEIKYPTKVVVAPDASPNNALYHYNLMGWSELYLGRSIRSKEVKTYAKKGAEYLLIHNKSYLSDPKLKEVLAYPIASFNNSIFVYDIRPFK